MARIRPISNPNIPIPNNPFYSPESNYINGVSGPFIVGSGLSINNITGVISSSGGGGGGAVSKVIGAAGISINPVSGVGNVTVSNTGVISIAAGSGISISGVGGNFVISSTSGASVNNVTASAPLSVANGTTTPAISIATATTTSSGVTTLVNSVSSTDSTKALTAAQGKLLQDQISSLTVASNIQLAGTINATTGLLLSVTSVGTSKGYVVGSSLPVASSTTNDTYVIVTTPGTLTPPGGSPTPASQGDWFLVSENTPTFYQWSFLNVGFDAPPATDTVAGIVELATNAETQIGTDVTRAVTPASAAATYVPLSTFSAKGTLIAGQAPSNPIALPVGTVGQLLQVDPTTASGLKWVTPPAGCLGTVTQVASGAGLTGGPITTVGALDLVVQGIAAGTYANPSITVNCYGVITGVSTGTAGIPCACITGKGALLTGTASSTPVALPVGTDGQILIADSTCSVGLKWAANTGGVTTISGTSPINVSAGANPVVTIDAASTTASGAVQLYNGVNNTSTTLALTAAQGKVLQDQITSLAVSGTVELAGTIDASTGNVVSVTSVGSADGYTVGSALPAASSTTNNTYVIVTTPGTMTPPGGSPTAATRGDWFLVSEITPGVYAWTFLNVGFDAPAATTSLAGIVCLSTDALAQAGTDATTALTPVAAASAYISKACITAKGTLVSGTAADTPTALAVGTDNQILVACAAASSGLCWTNPPAVIPAIPCACITAKGDLIVGASANNPVPLGVGTNGQVLTACSTAPNGVCWGVVPQATPTTLGTVLGCTNATNAALGCNALAANITGTGNVAIGLNAFCTSTVGVNNVFIGNCAGAVNLGSGSVGVGTAALLASTTSGRNVALGEAAACSNILGECITAIGWNALSATTGGCNTALGYCAGANITTGFQNVVIGPGAAAVSATGSCQLSIGFSATCNWLTGDGTKAIRPGAGIVDCTGSCGTASQVLTSTGSNSLCWATIPVATPTSQGTVLGRTDLGSGGLGFRALNSLTTGVYNVGIGQEAGCSITTGNRNVAIGVLALATQTTTCDNVGIGAEALRRTTTGFNNVAIGTTTLVFNTTGADNVAVGYDASRANTTGFQNVAIGVGSMYANSTFGQNTAVGTGTLRSYNGGTNGANDAFGALAMRSFVSGDYNVALGAYSLFCYTSGCFNTAAGHRALTDATTGACNTAFGAYAGQGLTTGVCNTAVGYAAQLLNGNNNTVLGNGAANVSGASNSVTLGNANITVIRAAVTSITALSDARDKTDVTALPVGLDFINSLNPVKFTWQMREPNEVKDGTSEAGFIAQDLQAAQAAAGADYLGLVYDEDPEKLEASAGKLIPVLVKAIQELSAQNKDLESRLAKLEANG